MTEPTAPIPTPDADVVRRLSSGRSHRRRWIVAGVALVVILGVVLALCGRRGPGDTRWETAPVEQGDLVLGVTAVGVLEPTDTTEVGSDQSGTVARVLVSENDPVVEGQELAELDTRALDLLVRQAESRVAQAEATQAQAGATAAHAGREAERTTRMREQGASSPNEEETARVSAATADAAFALARAQTQDARLALDIARRNLEEATIRSPLTGTVLTRAVEPGQTVVSALQAATLFEIAADLTRMTLPVEVDEAEVGRVQPGQAATFTVPAWVGRTFDATVVKVHIAPKSDTEVVSYVAELRVDNADLALRPGMTATARITTDRIQGALTVPAEALRFEPEDGGTPPDGPHVWLVDDGALRPVAVTVAGNDGTHAALRGEGLAAGAVVALRENGPRSAGPPGSKKEKR